MLTKHVKAYNSSCSQTVSYLKSFHHSSFLECAMQPKITKINFKNPYFGSSGSLKVIDVDMTE